jgi:CubicO group peptidase (beta-lactamase class C family)
MNFNVVEEQTLGGMFGVYRRINNTDFICYVSCGLNELNGSAPTETTLFELASVTKTFTTSILGKHQFNGDINPLDSVGANLPPGFNLNANENLVSYQQLATFSGGVCFSDAPSVNQSNPNQTVNQQNFVSDINSLNPDPAVNCPGNTANTVPIYTTPPYLPTKNFYSNSSVGLLGQALMTLEGLPGVLEPDFNNWICNNITNVLSMTMTSGCLSTEALNGSCGTSASSCHFVADWISGVYAKGYHISAGNYQLGNEFPFMPWAPAGGIRSNAMDMIKFIRANLGFTTNNTPEQLQLIQGMQLAHQANNYLPVPGGDTVKANIGSQSPLIGSQAYAWVCTNISPTNDRVCGKIGGHENFRSFLGINLDKNYGVIISFNTGALTTNGSFSTAFLPPSIGVIGTNLMRNVGN